MTLMHTVRNLPAVRAREGIPPAKRRAQFVKTLAGIAVFVGGFFLTLLGYPWYAGSAVSAFGAHIASAQLLRGFITGLAQFVQAISGKAPKDDSTGEA